MKHAKEFQATLDHLRDHRMAIERSSKDGHWIVMLCEHGAQLHYGKDGFLYHGVNTLRKVYAPRTYRLGTCPSSEHRSTHFFIQQQGRTWPAPCRMHPLPKFDDPKLRAVCQAAWQLDGWEAAQPIIEKHVHFDPLLWRLWDLHIWYQLKPDEFAG